MKYNLFDKCRRFNEKGTCEEFIKEGTQAICRLASLSFEKYVDVSSVAFSHLVTIGFVLLLVC